MIYTERSQLTIIELKNFDRKISIKKLIKVIEERPSNIIYCESLGKLVGIISMGDILRAYRNDLKEVQINRNFTFLFVDECLKARLIFEARENMNAIPILTKEHFLLGDYTRWDDFLILDYELDIAEENDFIWKDEDGLVVLVRPDSFFTERQRIFERFCSFLSRQNVTVEVMNYSELVQYKETADMILFVDENEIRSKVTLLEVVFGINCGGKDKTYKNLLRYNFFVSKQCTEYLKKLCSNGVKILGLEFEKSTYSEGLLNRLAERRSRIGNKPFYKWDRSVHKIFFDDLYNEEYVKQILDIPFIYEDTGGVLKLRDCKSEYYNVMNGERHTDSQPEKFVRSIYFFGPCYIYGLFVEDKNTIPSYLQRQLRDKGEPVRVVNYGSNGMRSGYEYFYRIADVQLRKGDIIVIPRLDIKNTINLNLWGILEKNHVGIEWLVDDAKHCNHKVNQMYADAIYEKIKPILTEEVADREKVIEKDDNFVKFFYLDRYFAGFNILNYEKIGSIVMNCNPFTLGHRYLIEQALHNMDFLIIFVVEEDKSIFSFAERFIMVCKGVADLKNVKVVPSGPFILSQMSFPEYFGKIVSENIIEHTESDIITFAEKIAPQVGIKYRFVGEEPEDEVTKQYNLTMKRILPQYGIELIEIPRKKVNGQHISASLVRCYMEQNDEDRMKILLPQTTREIILGGKIESKNIEVNKHIKT